MLICEHACFFCSCICLSYCKVIACLTFFLANKTSPSPSFSDGRDDWTLLDNDNEPNSPPPAAALNQPPQATSIMAASNSGGKFGGKFAKMWKSVKRSPTDSGPVSGPSGREVGSRKAVYNLDGQTCFKCKVVSKDVLGVMHGVTVTMPAFPACHQCCYAGLSLVWGLNLLALVCGIF